MIINKSIDCRWTEVIFEDINKSVEIDKSYILLQIS